MRCSLPQCFTSPKKSQHQPRRPSFTHNTLFSQLLLIPHYSIVSYIKHSTVMAGNNNNNYGNDGVANPDQVKL